MRCFPGVPVLPTEYSDALSYQEQLNKMLKIIENKIHIGDFNIVMISPSGLDDTNNIQTALDKSVAEGSILFVKNGKYNITSPIYIKSGAIIFGCNAEFIANIDSPNVGCFTSTGENNIYIKNIKITTNGAPYTHGMWFTNCSNIIIDTVFCVSDSSTKNGIVFTNCRSSKIKSYMAYNCTSGVYMDGCSGCSVSESESFSNKNHGFDFYRCVDTFISNSKIYQNADSGINVDDGALHISDCIITNNNRRGVSLWGASNVSIYNNTISKSGEFDILFGTSVETETPITCSNIVVQGNIINNIKSENGTHTNINLFDNIISTNGSNSIDIVSDSAYFTNNKIENKTDAPIYISGAGNYYISNNTITPKDNYSGIVSTVDTKVFAMYNAIYSTNPWHFASGETNFTSKFNWYIGIPT